MQRLLKIAIFTILLSLFIGQLTTAISADSSWTGVGPQPIASNKYWYIDTEVRIDDSLEFSNGNIVINSSGKLVIGGMGKLSLINVNMGFNTTGNGTPTIHVLSGGKLLLYNISTRIIFSPDSDLKYRIIIENNSTLKIVNSYFVLNSPIEQSIITISSSKIQVNNTTFGGGFSGLLLENIFNTTITNCTFRSGKFGAQIVNSSNITFDNCEFFDNSNVSCSLMGSGTIEPIKFINCTVTAASQGIKNDSFFIFRLHRSNISLINLSHFHFKPIEQFIDLDQGSRVDVSWYLNLRAVDKDGKRVGGADAVITDNSTKLIFDGMTNENGELNWITLRSKQIKANETKILNPFRIELNKNKGEYTTTTHLRLNSENTSKFQIIELVKKDEEGSEFDIDSNIFTICVCVMIIVTVFFLMLSLNLYLARRKAGLGQLGGLELGITKGAAQNGKARGQTSISGKDIITCSECGTMVTADTTFCPHCGEYFEGEEVFCPGCEARISDKDTSCPKCGKVFEHEKRGIVGKGTLKEGTDKRGKYKETIVAVGGTQEHDREFGDKEKLFCSECGAVVLENDKRCPGCGSIFSKKAKGALVKTQPKTTKQTATDRKLAYRLTFEEEKKLHRRKSKKPELKSESDELYMCSVCGADISINTKKCPKCGTELE
jgi:parallel beta-helix repeat protein